MYLQSTENAPITFTTFTSLHHYNQQRIHGQPKQQPPNDNMNSQHIQYFNGLQQETQKFQNEARTYDRQRRLEEDKLKNIRLTQLALEEKLRNIANELGQEIRNKKIEEEKHVRLRQAMASDHQAIIQMTNELQGLEADEISEKTKFVKEMESGLHEIDFLLNQRENERLLRLLEGETVKSLVDTKLAALMSEIGVGGGSSADELNNAAWTEISANVMEGLKDILDAEEKVSVALEERKELENLVQGLRAKFASENQVRLRLLKRNSVYPFVIVLIIASPPMLLLP
jgi:hypothetical protein